MSTEEGTGATAVPGVGISIIAVVVGAILRYAMDTVVLGVDVHTAGMVLMVVGAVGVLVSLLLWSSLSPFGRRQPSRAVQAR